MIVQLRNLGRIRYMESLRIQQDFVDQIKATNNETNYLLLVEHEPVYTTGIRNRDYTKLEEERLKSLGADFHRTNRGGLITFHGPGQLVAYPILNLLHFNPDHIDPRAKTEKRRALLGMKHYIHTLEQVVIDTVRKFNISGVGRSPHTGVWVGNGERKICAMGVHNSAYITSHGLALNCNIDLNWFKEIVPCGIVGKGVTSLSHELQSDTSIQNVIPVFLESFEENFNCKINQKLT